MSNPFQPPAGARLLLPLLLVLFFATPLVAAQYRENGELERTDTDEFVFYVPRGFESVPERAEGEVTYFYGNESGDSINVARFGYLAGRKLDQEVCSYLVREFDRSELRAMIHATEAREIDFGSENGATTCYYEYEVPRGNIRARVTYKVYQSEDLRTYTVTAVYGGSSTEEGTLQKALHSFTIKKRAHGSDEPSAPIGGSSDMGFVLVDHSELAFAVFTAVPRDTTDEQLRELRSQTAQRENVRLVPWNEFLGARSELVDSRILKDEYPGSRVAEGVVEVLRRYPGMPFGLTWNGGVALTFGDYEHAKRLYEAYSADPDAYAMRSKDPGSDPIHPRAHLGALLGWN